MDTLGTLALLSLCASKNVMMLFVLVSSRLMFSPTDRTFTNLAPHRFDKSRNTILIPPTKGVSISQKGNNHTKRGDSLFTNAPPLKAREKQKPIHNNKKSRPPREETGEGHPQKPNKEHIEEKDCRISNAKYTNSPLGLQKADSGRCKNTHDRVKVVKLHFTEKSSSTKR